MSVATTTFSSFCHGGLMKNAYKLLDLVRFAAAGGILASAASNVAFNPTQAWNVAAAVVGAALTLVLVKSRHMI